MSKRGNSTYRLLQRQSTAFLIAATLASVLLITAGLSLKSSQNFLSELFVAIGGGALGTCFGITFGSVSDASILQRIREMLEFSLERTLSAPEQNLDEYRKVWHHYLMTKINDKFVWRYRQFDFARLSVPGKIVATLAVPDAQGKIHNYNIEGFLIGPRLIFFNSLLEGMSHQ